MRAIHLALVAAALVGCGPGTTGFQEQKSIAPGATYFHIVTADPFDIHVLEIDLNAKGLRTEAFRTKGLVRTSELVAAANRQAETVIAGINGDFFSFKTGWPLGNQVSSGKFILGTRSVRSHFLIDERGKPGFEQLSFVGGLRTTSGKVIPVAGVNQFFHGDTVSFFTSSWYDSTGMVGRMSHVLLKRASSRWIVGDTMVMVCASRNLRTDGAIGEDDGLLAVEVKEDGTSPLDGFAPGDSVWVFLGFESGKNSIEQAIGGAGQILKNGELATIEEARSEKLGRSFLEARHPRTFVGFDKDTTRLFLCTVDGRQKSSLGMNFREMGELMLSLGAWNAVNLDGGGSTTFILEMKVLNSPSDKAGERPVANAIIIRQTQQ